MKGLEDIGVKYDGTVRTGNNIILQYIYSDFNLDQTKQKKVPLMLEWLMIHYNKEN